MGPGLIARYLGTCPPHSRSCSASLWPPDSASSPIPAPISGCSGSSPSGDASPTTAVTVTFDRPVAGSLDRTVDPGRRVRDRAGGRRRGRLARSRHPSLPPRRAAHAEHELHRDRGEQLRRDGRQPPARAVRLYLPRPRPSRARRLADRPERWHALPGARRPVRPGPSTRRSTPPRSSQAVYLYVQPPVRPVRVRSRLAVEGGARQSRRTTGGTSARPADGIATARPTRSAGWSGWPPRRRCRTGAAASWSCPPPSTSAVGPNPSTAGASPPTGDFRLARAGCGWSQGSSSVPRGRSSWRFSTPVRGADSASRRAPPAVPFALGDTADIRPTGC